MISIKSIDVHIGHDSSVGVCFAKRSGIHRIGNRHFAILSPPFPERWRVGPDSFLVLVFAATCSEMALGSVLLIRIGKQNVEIKYIFQLKS